MSFFETLQFLGVTVTLCFADSLNVVLIKNIRSMFTIKNDFKYFNFGRFCNCFGIFKWYG